LDAQLAAALVDVVSAGPVTPAAVVLATHDLTQALQLASRVLCCRVPATLAADVAVPAALTPPRAPRCTPDWWNSSVSSGRTLAGGHWRAGQCGLPPHRRGIKLDGKNNAGEIDAAPACRLVVVRRRLVIRRRLGGAAFPASAADRFSCIT